MTYNYPLRLIKLRHRALARLIKTTIQTVVQTIKSYFALPVIDYVQIELWQIYHLNYLGVEYKAKPHFIIKSHNQLTLITVDSIKSTVIYNVNFLLIKNYVVEPIYLML